MTAVGIKRLTEMQLSDGGWGWFSGYGERSSAHMTAQVVRGLTLAKKNGASHAGGAKINQSSLDKGISWLRRYLDTQLELIENGRKGNRSGNYKLAADNLDAFVLLTLVESGADAGKNT